jgi:hypothetical protein
LSVKHHVTKTEWEWRYRYAYSYPETRFRRLGGHLRKSVCSEGEFSGLFECTVLELAWRGCGNNLGEYLYLRERK